MRKMNVADGVPWLWCLRKPRTVNIVLGLQTRWGDTDLEHHINMELRAPNCENTSSGQADKTLWQHRVLLGTWWGRLRHVRHVRHARHVRYVRHARHAIIGLSHWVVILISGQSYLGHSFPTRIWTILHCFQIQGKLETIPNIQRYPR